MFTDSKKYINESLIDDLATPLQIEMTNSIRDGYFERKYEMNKVHLIAGGALVAFFSAGTAMAEPFDGPYVGLQAGYEANDVSNPTTELGVMTYDDSQGSFTGGIYAGFDKKVTSNLVLGAEAGFGLASNDSFDGTIGGSAASISPDWSLDLTARAGYLLDSKSLLYVRGGYENDRIEATALDANSFRLSESENRDGWTAGAGLERQLLQNVSARLEYRYSDLSDGDDTWKRHRVLTGLSYRF
jgi:outer membrane immunogenic protein